MDSRPLIGMGALAALFLLGKRRLKKAMPKITYGEKPGLPPFPGLEAVINAFNFYGYPLPQEGRATIVSLIYRNTPAASEPYDPWDDWVGAIRNNGGVIEGIFFQGTVEPGAKPMYFKGDIPTNANGVVRTIAPQYAPNVYGGGYHHWNEKYPAFRQVGKQRVERFKVDKEEWVDAGWTKDEGAMNLHTTSNPNSVSVGDWSHGCTVVLNPAEHAQLRDFAGWTAELDANKGGVRLDLAAFLIDANGNIILQK